MPKRCGNSESIAWGGTLLDGIMVFVVFCLCLMKIKTVSIVFTMQTFQHLYLKNQHVGTIKTVLMHLYLLQSDYSITDPVLLYL